MTLKFRLEDTCVQPRTESRPIVSRIVKINHPDREHPRCDTPTAPCYGCDSAELKKTQEDIHPYIKAG